jgi:hypothetical protein
MVVAVALAVGSDVGELGFFGMFGIDHIVKAGGEAAREVFTGV